MVVWPDFFPVIRTVISLPVSRLVSRWVLAVAQGRAALGVSDGEGDAVDETGSATG